MTALRFQKEVNEQRITHAFGESERKNQVWKVDIAILELKNRWHHKMVTINTSNRLWCYGIKHQDKMMQFILQG